MDGCAAAWSSYQALMSMCGTLSRHLTTRCWCKGVCGLDKLWGLCCLLLAIRRWGMFFTCVGGFSQPLHYASLVSPAFVMLLLK